MKSDKIVKKFKEYLELNEEKVKELPEGVNPDIIYGSDEFKIKGDKIRLPQIGWVQLKGKVNPKNISWAAMTTVDGEKFEISFGFRISPFSEEAKNTLTVMDDIIIAMPFKISKLENFI